MAAKHSPSKAHNPAAEKLHKASKEVTRYTSLGGDSSVSRDCRPSHHGYIKLTEYLLEDLDLKIQNNTLLCKHGHHLVKILPLRTINNLDVDPSEMTQTVKIDVFPTSLEVLEQALNDSLALREQCRMLWENFSHLVQLGVISWTSAGLPPRGNHEYKESLDTSEKAISLFKKLKDNLGGGAISNAESSSTTSKDSVHEQKTEDLDGYKTLQ